MATKTVTLTTASGQVITSTCNPVSFAKVYADAHQAGQRRQPLIVAKAPKRRHSRPIAQ
jgi:hypothetical protein